MPYLSHVMPLPPILQAPCRVRRHALQCVAAVCCVLPAFASGAQTSPSNSGLDTVAIANVRNALAAIGGEGAIARAGGLVVEGSGHADLGVRLQGMRPDAT
jgi:hypothetical protein